MSFIDFESVSKSYSTGGKVLHNLNLKVEKGEFVTILGQSGCGKTTLIKMVNKLIEPTSGVIKIEGKELSQWNTITLRRSIGYVIQHIGLFPHLSIEDNISYVLSLLKVEKSKRRKRARELIKLVGLKESHLSKYPRELSGGQNQRIGVARAMAADPQIILMDEPFGAVDEITRVQLQDELKSIQRRLNKTILFVTHDIEEALKLGTKIVLLNSGNIEQSGTKNDLIFKPETKYVKSFFGLKGFKTTISDSQLEEMYKDAKEQNK